MPDFIATLVAVAVFCIGVVALNALTRLALQMQLAPAGLAEGGVVQFGAALILAHAVWRRSVHTPVR